MMYTYGFNRYLSSKPSHLTACNGLNLSKSVTNPNSRFRRMMDYLSVKGEATKVDILRDVFGKTIGVSRGEVTRGWGSCLFNLVVANGYVKKVRRGNKVYYSVN